MQNLQLHLIVLVSPRDNAPLPEALCKRNSAENPYLLQETKSKHILCKLPLHL